MAKKTKPETKEFPFLLTKMDEEAGTFTGYASVWDVLDSWGDMVIKGAFKRTIKNKKEFPLLWSHDVSEPIGILTAEEDEKGLLITGQLALDVPRASSLRSLMKIRAVKGLSIGFRTVREEFDKETGVRKLKEIDLWEVSLCVFQACPEAVIEDVKADRRDASYLKHERECSNDEGEWTPTEGCKYCDALLGAGAKIASANDALPGDSGKPTSDGNSRTSISDPELCLHSLESLRADIETARKSIFN